MLRFEPLEQRVVLNGTALLGTSMNGIISTDTTWTASESPYIVSGNILVEQGVTLKILPGVRVLVEPNEDIYIRVDGVLQALGVADAPIVFDTTDPEFNSQNGWSGIRIRDTSSTVVDGDGNWLSGTTIQHATIRHASRGLYVWNTGFHGESIAFDTNNKAIELLSTRGVYISDSDFSNNKFGIWTVEGGSDGDRDGQMFNVHIVDNRFSGNSTAIEIHNSRIWKTLNLQIANNSFLDNTDNGVFIRRMHPNDVHVDSNIFRGNGTAINLGDIGRDPSGIEIANNIIEQSVSNGMSIGYWSSTNNGKVLVRNNIIAENSGAFLETGSNSGVHFFGNSVIRNENGIRLHRYGSNREPSNWTIHGNTFWGTAGTVLDAGRSGPVDTFFGNNLENNSSDFLVFSDNAWDINATGNYWGREVTAELDSSAKNISRIFDYQDEFDNGLVDMRYWSPSLLTAPPIAPPSGVQIEVTADSVHLSWLPNEEADLAGYRVYYDTDSGYPYEGSGAYEGPSGVDVGNVTNFTLTGLDLREIHHITVAAYDTQADGADDLFEGHESWFARDVIVSKSDVGGTVWNDLDGNGARDADETSIDGVAVTLYRDDGDGMFEQDGEDVVASHQLPGCPALDAGSNTLAHDAGVTHDQRGFNRFVDADEDGTATVDIGAYEQQVNFGNGGEVSVQGEPVLPDWMILYQSEHGQAGEQTTEMDLHVVGNSRTLDLTSMAENEFLPIRAIDIIGSGANALILDQVAVLNVSDETNRLYVLAGDEDSVTIGDGWSYVGAQMEDEDFFRVLQHGEARLFLSGPRNWQNPQSPRDVNFDQTTDAADVLVIINMLNGDINGDILQAGGSQFVDPRTLEDFPGVFPDTSGDGAGSPIDALIVINYLNDQNAAAEGEFAPAIFAPPLSNTLQSQSDRTVDLAGRPEQGVIWPDVQPITENADVAHLQQYASQPLDEASVDLLLSGEAAMEHQFDLINEI